MQEQRDALLCALLGFALTSAVMAPPIIAHEMEKAERIAAHDAAMGDTAVRLGRDRQARLAYLLRGMDKAELQRAMK